MKLVRILVKDCLINNRRVFVKHIRSEKNERADALSRVQWKHFWRCSPPTTFKYPDKIDENLWPVDKV